MAIRKTYDLDMIPGGVPLVVHVNQYDDDFTLVFQLYAREGTFTIAAGTTASIRGTKRDGNGYSVDAVLDTENQKVTVKGDQQMTAIAGQQTFELTLWNGTQQLNTANFILEVERAALDKDTLPSGSKIRELVNVIDKSDEIIKAGEQYEKSQKAMEECAASTAADRKAVAEMKDTVLDHGEMIKKITTTADELAARAMETASNADNEASEAGNNIDALRRNAQAIQMTLEGKVDGAFVEQGYLYLTSNNEVVAGPLGPFSGTGGGSGGGSGNNASLSVANVSGWLSKTISHGSSCIIKLNWSSVEDDLPTGNGTMKIAVNGAVRAMIDITQGEVSVDVSNYLSVGSNIVKVTVSDIYDNSRTVNFSITDVDLSITSSFDSGQIHTSAILFPYTPVGAVSKTIHFILDGTEIGTATTSVSNRQMNYTIPAQSHGGHTLQCYFDAEINGEIVRSNELYYEFISVDPLSDVPIVVSSFHEESVTQYTTIPFSFTVYDPASLTTEVKLYVNDRLVSTQTVDRTEQTYAYRADDVGELSFKIVAGETEKVLTVNITESDIRLEAETESLALYLSSAGRSNNEEKRDEWRYKDIAAVLSNFNFRSDGWVSDPDGVTVMRVAGDARITIPYQPFKADFRATGKTIELEFATRNVMDYDTEILSCMSGGRGFSLTAQKALLKSEQSEISTQYKEDEHVRISFVVEKRSEHRLVYIYINGIMSGAVQYPADDDFMQKTPVNITIGSNDCTIDLYAIRIYDNDLTRSQILNNWIADTQVVEDLIARYRRNLVYDEYGNVVIAKLPSDLPYMIISCPELPQYKGDKKTVSVEYVDPQTPSNSFTADNVEANVQGTSSQYYPRKNYKIKFKQGLTMRNGTQTDTYKLRADSIPTKTFCLKADVASSEGANNVELVRLYCNACPYETPAQKKDERIRQGIDGFPMVVFWNNGSGTSFLGKYNFNNDKSTEEVYGFTEGDESWEILNNTSDRVLWKSDDYSGDGWLNDFEARYPDEDPPYTDPAQLQEFATWIKSTDVTGITDPAEKERRLKKFKDELGDYVEIDSALFYYLFTELFLMVDSRAKNAFPSFIGNAADKEVTS